MNEEQLTLEDVAPLLGKLMLENLLLGKQLAAARQLLVGEALGQANGQVGEKPPAEQGTKA